MALWTYTAVALFLTFQCAYGNGVSLDNNPKVIQTILTQVMTMQCSINDTGAVNDLRFVTSLVVTRNGQEVASITPFSPAVALQDLTSLNVTGHVSMANGAEGVLLLKWTYPDAAQSGNYSCEVNGVNTVGHPVAYSTIVTVPVRQPTLDDITIHVRDQQKILESHQLDSQYLKAQNLLHKADVNYLQMEMAGQKQEQKLLNQSATRIQNKMALVASMLDETRHVESGTAVCGDSNSWTDTGSYKEVDVTTNFTTTYGSPPVIHAGVSHIVNYNSNSNYADNIRYEIDVVEANESNFTLRCKIYDSSYLRLEEIDVDWFTIGQMI